MHCHIRILVASQVNYSLVCAWLWLHDNSWNEEVFRLKPNVTRSNQNYQEIIREHKEQIKNTVYLFITWNMNTVQTII